MRVYVYIHSLRFSVFTGADKHGKISHSRPKLHGGRMVQLGNHCCDANVFVHPVVLTAACIDSQSMFADRHPTLCSLCSVDQSSLVQIGHEGLRPKNGQQLAEKWLQA